MDKIISPYQASHISGRMISTIIAQETIQSMKNKRGEKGWMALKLDMSKSFDRLEWNFLIKVIQYFGFSNDLCDLVYQCISTTSLSVMLNGSPYAEFHPTRSLRQGDPLSPYLFILEMKFLYRHLIKDNEDKKKIIAIKVAGDFNTQSGQVLNFDKSSVYFNKITKLEVASTLTQILGVKIMDAKNKYLGLPLILGHSKQESFRAIKDNFIHILSGWSSSTLTQAGRFGKELKMVLKLYMKIISWSESIMPNTNERNISLVNTLFDALTAARTSMMYLDITSEDYVIWMVAKDGIFSIKSTYNMLANIQVDAQVSGVVVPSQIWKALWKSNVAHKTKLFVCKCIRDIIPTRRKTDIFNVEAVTVCGRCVRVEETLEHLLLDCRHSRAYWRLINVDIYALEHLLLDCRHSRSVWRLINVDIYAVKTTQF
ncbi:uncharacterized protein LOC113305243 [Papaver somniferum]|uniref:uncharacterized protein LOC113305243 n=1 Tax=Papaver somniferum TaxID=3469 RepID=UPI000E6FC902|nr:uncharacterized protein LOC113305243 [Papaver somniferum]